MLRILHLEDSVIDARLVEATLRREQLEAQLVRVETHDAFLDALRKGGFDLIIADYSLPSFDGLAALELARQHKPEIPFIFLSGALGEVLAIETLKKGATDYVLKQGMERLAPSVRRALREAQEHRELKAAEEGRRRSDALAEQRLNELNATNQRLRMALEAGRMGAWEWEIATGNVIWSPALEVLHGYAPGTFPGNFAGFESQIHPEDRERVKLAIDMAVEKITDLAMEYRTVWGDGSVHWMESRGRLLLDENNQPLRMIGVCADVTERKNSERERQELLAREKAARAEAEGASRAKDEFLATLSHELRTPLTPMLGWVRILRIPNIDREKAAHGLEVIERNVKAQAQLIEDLLDVSRIITGKLQLNVRMIDLVTVITSALEVVRPSAEAKGVKLDAKLDREASVFLGDPDRLQQVVWNLVNNAIKFTPRDGKITVELARADATLRLSVTDTGEGISADFLPQLFSRFTQADSSKTRVHGGLGLGLSIVRHLVELHGGHVEASSAGKGTGATFTVYLPQAVAGEDLTKTGRYGMKGGNTQPEPLLRGIKVLVVDDEADARDFLNTALGAYGAQVSSAASVQDAVDQMQRNFPDVLISDLGMPGQDGFALMETVKRIEAQTGRKLPAVALTAYAGSEDQARTRDAGFVTHIAKPVDPLELANQVMAAMRK